MLGYDRGMKRPALRAALLGATLGLAAPAFAQSGPPGGAKGVKDMGKVKLKARSGLDDLEREARRDLAEFEAEAKKKGEAKAPEGRGKAEDAKTRAEAGKKRAQAARGGAEAARGEAEATRGEAEAHRDRHARGDAEAAQRDKTRRRWRAVLGERPASPEVVLQEGRHAERLARLDRIEGIAIEKGDQKVLARVRQLRDKEEARHQAWLLKKAAEGEAAPAPGEAEAEAEAGAR
jgi:hypothetical protein